MSVKISVPGPEEEADLASKGFKPAYSPVPTESETVQPKTEKLSPVIKATQAVAAADSRKQTPPNPEPIAQNLPIEELPAAAPKNVDAQSLIDKASQDYGIPIGILRAQAFQESGLDNDAVSSKGARGIMQLEPRTADALGVDPSDPAQNVDGGARYLKQLHTRFKTYDKALAAYNAGPDRVTEAVNKYGDDWLDHMPEETRRYVHKILRKAAA